MLTCVFRNAKKAAAAKEIEKVDLDISDLELTKEEGSRDVYRLPPPEPLPIDEYGRQISIRVPPPLPRPEDEPPFDINYVSSFSQTSKYNILEPYEHSFRPTEWGGCSVSGFAFPKALGTLEPDPSKVASGKCLECSSLSSEYWHSQADSRQVNF